MGWGEELVAAPNWICKVTAWNNCWLQKIAQKGLGEVTYIAHLHAEAQLALQFILRNAPLTSSYKVPLALGKAIDNSFHLPV